MVNLEELVEGATGPKEMLLLPCILGLHLPIEDTGAPVSNGQLAATDRGHQNHTKLDAQTQQTQEVLVALLRHGAREASCLDWNRCSGAIQGDRKANGQHHCVKSHHKGDENLCLVHR